MKLYIHIGWPKTGTSAIQSHIFINRGWFESNGVHIPKTGYASGLGHAFLAGAESLPTVMAAASDSAHDTSQFRQLADELEECAENGFQSALVSSEGLALVEDSVIESAREHLGKHDITVIAYVREQVALYQSETLQEFELLLNTPAKRFYDSGCIPPAKLQNYDFAARLARWKTIFQEDINIRVRMFQRDLLKQQNVVLDFIDCLSMEIDNNFLLRKKNVNHSLDMNAAAILLIAREAGMPKKGMQRLSRALSVVAEQGFSGSQQFLQDADQQFLRDHFNQSNEQLMQSFEPENAVHSGALFGDQLTSSKGPGTTAHSPEHGVVFYRAVYDALASPARELWEGGVLTGLNLGKLTGPPGTGWRGPERDGIWSVGPSSELAFDLPEVHPTRGPSAIRLVIGGVYFEGHTSTSVTIKDTETELDLTHAVITVALDQSIKDEGIQISLQHRAAESNDSGRENEDLSFKLQLLSYDFVWT